MRLSIRAMYIDHLHICSLKLLEDFQLDFREPDGSPRMWTVIIGENGTAKTSILQAIALAAAGALHVNGLAKPVIGRLRDRRRSAKLEVTTRFRFEALGILFGVAAVIGILSIGEGARREQDELIAKPSGVALGFAIAKGVAAFTGWSTAVSPGAVLLATALSTAEGVIFGFIPAQRAAKLPPAIAVRTTN